MKCSNVEALISVVEREILLNVLKLCVKVSTQDIVVFSNIFMCHLANLLTTLVNLLPPKHRSKLIFL
jgi:hypothetical protein